jgi:hypothetical protein
MPAQADGEDAAFAKAVQARRSQAGGRHGRGKPAYLVQVGVAVAPTPWASPAPPGRSTPRPGAAGPSARSGGDRGEARGRPHRDPGGARGWHGQDGGLVVDPRSQGEPAAVADLLVAALQAPSKASSTTATWRGRRTVNSAPTPASLRHETSPPWRATAACTKARPRPTPLAAKSCPGRSNRWNGRNAVAASSREKPGPWSAMATLAVGPLARAAQRGDGDGRALGAVLHRVAQQVDQGAGQHAAIAQHGQGVVAADLLDPHLALYRLRPDLVDGLDGDVGQVDGLQNTGVTSARASCTKPSARARVRLA